MGDVVDGYRTNPTHTTSPNAQANAESNTVGFASSTTVTHGCPHYIAFSRHKKHANTNAFAIRDYTNAKVHNYVHIREKNEEYQISAKQKK